MDELLAAIKSGVVKVTKTGGGYSLSGGTYPYKEFIKAQYGAKWDRYGKQWIVKGVHKELEQATAATVKAAGEAAKRGVKVAAEGVKEFDRQRMKLQQQAAADLKDVYQQAYNEHSAKIDELIKLSDKATDQTEYMSLLYRRGELELLLNDLTDGYQQAAKDAEAVVNGVGVKAKTTSMNVAAWQVDMASGMRLSRFIGYDDAAKALVSDFGKVALHDLADAKKARDVMRKQISRGLLTGENPRKIASRLKGLFDGTTSGSAYKRALRIAQTETNRIMSETTQDVLKQANEFGVGVANMWDCTLDSHTRKSHRKVDGEIRKVGKKFSNGLARPASGSPAESINCRCALVPVVEGFEPDVKLRRDQITGETIPYQKYSEWEKKGRLKNRAAASVVKKPEKPLIVQPEVPKEAKNELIKFKEATTINEARSFMADELGFTDVSKAFTLEEANAINGAFTKIMNEYPFIRGSVSKINTGGMKAFAYYGYSISREGKDTFRLNNLFKFNRARMKGIDETTKGMFERGWSTKKDGIHGIVAHEMTHAMELEVTARRLGIKYGETLFDRNKMDAFKRTTGQVSGEVVMEAFKRLGLGHSDTSDYAFWLKNSRRDIQKHISTYGATDSFEALAEAISCSDENNEVCNMVKTVWKELLQKEGLL